MSTTNATTEGRIQRKNAAPATLPAEPSADLGMPPLDAALSRLKATREKDVESALKVYREHVFALADDVRLSGAQMDALSHSLRDLDLSPDDVKADVLAIRSHRGQLKACDASKAVMEEIKPKSKGWIEEQEKLNKRLLEINAERWRLETAETLLGRHRNEADTLVRRHPRILGSLSTAIAAATAPPPGPYVPQVIRSNVGAEATATAAAQARATQAVEVPQELLSGAKG